MIAMAQTFDAIVIGAGQAGPPLAGRLTAGGLKVALIERGKFGGTCVNTGCMPTKTLVASAYAAHLARRGGDYGLMLDRPVHIDMIRVRKKGCYRLRQREPRRRKLAASYGRLYRHSGAARFEGPNEVSVGAERFSAPRIFINVGGRAIAPDMPGLDRIPYLTTESVLELERVPQHLVVIGGSYIGLEFAQMYRRFGARVTVIEKGPRLIGQEDADISEAVRGGREHRNPNVGAMHRVRSPMQTASSGNPSIVKFSPNCPWTKSVLFSCSCQ
jgi:pyruvate/2-oxoglutarate dehydrogenase complex dihydrolipoamide dehydrogenase (E3) component